MKSREIFFNVRCTKYIYTQNYFHIYAYPYDVLTYTLKYEDFIRNLNKKLLYLTVVRNNITLKCKQCEVLLNFTTFIFFFFASRGTLIL